MRMARPPTSAPPRRLTKCLPTAILTEVTAPLGGRRRPEAVASFRAAQR